MKDEYWASHKLVNQLPWWLPFNMFIHEWELGLTEGNTMHSHPRWSVTIVLRGEIHEVTPTYNRVLKRGHIVIRTHKAIHKFFTSSLNKEKCVTLFIVGRRKYTQYEYNDSCEKIGMLDGAQL